VHLSEFAEGKKDHTLKLGAWMIDQQSCKCDTQLTWANYQQLANVTAQAHFPGTHL
jgi:hypothetical protein